MFTLKFASSDLKQQKVNFKHVLKNVSYIKGIEESGRTRFYVTGTLHKIINNVAYLEQHTLNAETL